MSRCLSAMGTARPCPAAQLEAALSSAPPCPPQEQGALRRLIYCSQNGWSLMWMLVCYILCGQLTSYLSFVARCLAKSQHLDTPVSVPSTAEGSPWVSMGVQAVTSSHRCWGSTWQSVCTRARCTCARTHTRARTHALLWLWDISNESAGGGRQQGACLGFETSLSKDKTAAPLHAPGNFWCAPPFWRKDK